MEIAPDPAHTRVALDTAIMGGWERGTRALLRGITLAGRHAFPALESGGGGSVGARSMPGRHRRHGGGAHWAAATA